MSVYLNNATRNVTLRHLRAFHAVAQHGSFVAAARALFVTQSALSGSIRQLEELLGVRLFDRTTRTTGLTDAGRIFLEEVRIVLGTLEQGVRKMQELSSLNEGRVAIAAAPSVLAALVLPCVQALQGRYPNLRVTLREDSADAIIRYVREGAVDFGVGGWHPSAADMDVKPLLKDPLGVVGPASHPLFAKKALNLADLAHEAFVGLTRDTAISQMLAEETSLPESVREPTLRVSNPWPMQQAVGSGLGLGVLPALMLQQPEFHQLAFLPFSAPSIARDIMVFKTTARSLSMAATLYYEALLASAPHTVRPNVSETSDA